MRIVCRFCLPAVPQFSTLGGYDWPRFKHTGLPLSLSAQHLFLALEALHTLLCQDNRHVGLKQAQTGEPRCVCGRYRKALHHQASLYKDMTS